MYDAAETLNSTFLTPISLPSSDLVLLHYYVTILKPSYLRYRPSCTLCVAMGSISYSDPQYANPLISERSIDEPRPLKVIYLGAGVSGIVAAIKFPEYVPNIELTIYEKNADVGGTW